MATWAAWVEVVAEWFIGLTSGMWGYAVHSALRNLKWAGANLLESAWNLGGFALMSRRTHALYFLRTWTVPVVDSPDWSAPGADYAGVVELLLEAGSEVSGDPKATGDERVDEVLRRHGFLR